MSSLYEADKGTRLKAFQGKCEDWPAWKNKFEAQLEKDSLLDALLATEDRPEEEGEALTNWIKSSRKIYAALVIFTDGAANDLVVQFNDQRDGIAAWRALVRKYELRGDVQKAALQRAMYEAEWSNADDPDAYFVQLELKQRQLRALGVTMTDAQMVGLARWKMPSRYAALNPVLDCIESLTYDVLKERVRVSYRRDATSQAQGSDMALMTTFEGKCFKCGAYGHKKADCPNKGNRGNGGGGRGVSSKGSKGRSYGGAKVTCDHCKKTGHLIKDCWALRREKREAAHVATEDRLALIAMSDTPGSAGSLPFVLDSGSTANMVESADCLIDVKLAAGEVIVADGKKVASIGTGRLDLLTADVNGKHLHVTLNDVVIVPGLSRRLLSVRKIVDKGGRVVIDPSGGFIEVGGRIIPIRKTGPLYEVDMRVESATGGPEMVHLAVNGDVWHARLGHRNAEDLKKLGKLGVRVPQGLNLSAKCEVCEVSKHRHSSFPSAAAPGMEGVLDRVHIDLIGPMDKESLGGARFAFVAVDSFSRYLWVCGLKQKSQALEALKAYEGEMSALLGGKRIKSIRCDNGGEFANHRFRDYCQQRGILQTFTGPHCPQENGRGERAGGSLVGMTRCLLEHSGLSKELWGEAIKTAAYLMNRLPTRVLDGDTPYHRLFRKHASLHQLRVFGCRTFVQVYDGNRQKLDPRAWRGILVGYDPHNQRCYRVYDPSTGKVHRSVHVTFDEQVFPARAGAATNEESREVATPPSSGDQGGAVAPVGAEPPDDADGADGGDGEQKEEDAGDNGGNGEPEEEVPAPGWRWSQDVERRADSLGRTILPDGRSVGRRAASRQHHARLTIHHALASATSIVSDPASYEEALRSPDAPKWTQACAEEYGAHHDIGTWTLVVPPPGANVIGSRWVFKTKLNELGEISRLKARFVAQGFSQVPGQDFFDTYAPVAKLSSIRTILAIAAVEDWELQQMDVDTAFLQSPVTEEIYVRQPQGYEQFGPNGEELVCKLHKSLYGLKQAPRNWNKVLDDWLREYGLEPSGADPCVYAMRCADDLLVIVVYVDDLVIGGSNKHVVDQFKCAIAKRFKMKDLGNLLWLLGMEVRRDRVKRILEIHQTAYIDRLLERFGMSKCKPVGTPAEGVLARLPSGDGKPSSDYRSVVGGLLYAAMVTRPDIAYAVQVLGRHLQASGPEHWTAAMRVMRYLQGTRELGIVYGVDASSGVVLQGYADADWAGDRDTRRSTTGYVFMVAGGTVSWSSKLQPTVALSSAEAEYMAACSAVQEAVHIRRLLGDLEFQQEQPTVIYEDNQGCIALSANPVLHQRTKHIDIRYHFTREKVESGEVVLQYVATEHQLADLLTKALLSFRVAYLRGLVLGYEARSG